MEDSYVWQPLPSGEYSTRSGYHAATNPHRHRITDNPDMEFDWIKDVWSTSCSPKTKVFLWSALRYALPLGQNLQRRGVTSDVTCPRCKSIETPIHTFFLCPFAKKVWENIPMKDTVHIAVTDTFREAVVKFRSAVCLPPTGVPGNLLPWVCWTIWKDRNLVIFEGRNNTPEDLASKSVELAAEWKKAQSSIEKKQQSYIIPQIDRLDTVTQQDVVICMSDAAWEASTSRAGLAWILKGEDPLAVRSGATIQHFVNSPLVAEALSLREGLFMAAEQGIQHLWCCSDNLTLIRAIKNKVQKKELLGIIEDIQHQASGFVSIEFFHVSRENNEEADALAKTALTNPIV